MSSVHQFIFTLIITFIDKYKALQIFLSSDFLKMSQFLILVLSNTLSFD